MSDDQPLDLIGRGRMLAPAVTAEQEEQWSTLCSVAMPEGVCPKPAVDSSYPLKICGPHLGLAVGLAITRFTQQARMTVGTLPAEGESDDADR